MSKQVSIPLIRSTIAPFPTLDLPATEARLGEVLGNPDIQDYIRNAFPDIIDPKLSCQMPTKPRNIKKTLNMTPENFQKLGGVLSVTSKSESLYKSMVTQSAEDHGLDGESSDIMMLVQQLRNDLISQGAQLSAQMEASRIQREAQQKLEAKSNTQMEALKIQTEAQKKLKTQLSAQTKALKVHAEVQQKLKAQLSAQTEELKVQTEEQQKLKARSNAQTKAQQKLEAKSNAQAEAQHGLEAEVQSLKKKVEMLSDFGELHIRILINIAFQKSKAQGHTYASKAQFLTRSDALTAETKKFFKTLVRSGTYKQIHQTSHFTRLGYIAQTIQSLVSQGSAAPYEELFTYCFQSTIQDSMDSMDSVDDLQSE
ncbi:hypothetical protein AOL_s00080g61 [Orbilia oligospora ATCC 24927]|uniref:Uncharacterized protein n=1 Tax=Arthrobotrys oligospora (strain ATCC 24927 / CBS 115.81 / DSM 1491) TaxID=756982 RepID=G1XE26_ARTOA|nr:hypothetical protein AOL_s00080g61 [Orbilia oligospora ATCC 24927]EGX48432.1 hypothetical protein AOL_s00080g61 [Orbilia oligospora ATCC 24927]